MTCGIKYNRIQEFYYGFTWYAKSLTDDLFSNSKRKETFLNLIEN